jgi:hypothetical protein
MKATAEVKVSISERPPSGFPTNFSMRAASVHIRTEMNGYRFGRLPPEPGLSDRLPDAHLLHVFPQRVMLAPSPRLIQHDGGGRVSGCA